MLHGVFGNRGVSTLAAFFAAGTFVLPGFMSVLSFLSAVGLGLGTGAGLFYGAWKERKINADVKAQKLWDETLKESIQHKLDDAIRENGELRIECVKLAERVERVEKENDRERAESIELARFLMERKGFIRGPSQS